MRLKKEWGELLIIIEQKDLDYHWAILEITCSDCFHNYFKKANPIYYESFKEIIESSLDNSTMSCIYQQIICEVFNFEEAR